MDSTDWKDSLYQKILEHLLAATGAGDYLASLEVTATKLARAKCCG